MSKGYYYHAGCYDKEDDNVTWSRHTRRSLSRAQTEAKRMAKRFGGKGFVEHWDSDHGINPCNADCGSICWRDS